MRLSMIAAHSLNGVIGRNGKIPWHQPEDFRRFRETTMGNAVIMGRKTYESLRKPLDGRLNIVLTKNKNKRSICENLVLARDLGQAVRIAEAMGSKEAFVAGGQQVYADALYFVDRVYLTIVKFNCSGDTYFPSTFDDYRWIVTGEEDFPADAKNPHPMKFLIADKC